MNDGAPRNEVLVRIVDNAARWRPNGSDSPRASTRPDHSVTDTDSNRFEWRAPSCSIGDGVKGSCEGVCGSIARSTASGTPTVLCDGVVSVGQSRY